MQLRHAKFSGSAKIISHYNQMYSRRGGGGGSTLWVGAWVYFGPPYSHVFATRLDIFTGAEMSGSELLTAMSTVIAPFNFTRMPNIQQLPTPVICQYLFILVCLYIDYGTPFCLVSNIRFWLLKHLLFCQSQILSILLRHTSQSAALQVHPYSCFSPPFSPPTLRGLPGHLLLPYLYSRG